MSSLLESYHHLDVATREIRLLRLSPSGDHHHTLVHCSVHHISLDNSRRPAYHALSYVWGDPSTTKPIQVGNSQVLVPVNLALALQHVRSKREDILLWADAICINQADVTEKNSQVSMMASIYEEAASVIVWLGDESEDSGLAMSTVEEWGGPQLNEERYLLEKIRADGFDAARWSAVDNLFSRPYWQRRWVFQEILLGHNVQVRCGSDTVAWDKFQGLEEAWYQVLRKVDGLLPITVAQEDAIKDSNIRALVPFTNSDETDKWKKSKRTMTAMLENTAHFKCSDPKDHLFSIMSLAKDADIFPPPDYSKSLLEVYLGFARAHISATGSLNILGESAIRSSGREPAGELKMPSWIPDWRVEPSLKPLGRFSNIYNASQDQKLPSDSFDLLDNGIDSSKNLQLHVRGVVADKVLLLHEQSMDSVAMMIWALVSGITSGVDPVHPSGYPFLNVLFKTLLLDHDYRIRFSDVSLTAEEFEAPDIFFQMAEGFLFLVCFQWGYLKDIVYQDGRPDEVLFDINLRFLKEGSDLAVRYPKFETMKSFMDAVRSETRDGLDISLLTYKTIKEAIQKYTMASRVLFETERHLFGVATRGLQAGDLVVVLQGYKAPVILREENEVYNLVGEAFVYGLMHGEAFDSDHDRLNLDLPPVRDFILG